MSVILHDLLFSGHVSGDPGSNFSMLIKLMFSFSSGKKMKTKPFHYFILTLAHCVWVENGWFVRATTHTHCTQWSANLFFDRQIGDGFIVVVFRHTHFFGVVRFEFNKQNKSQIELAKSPFVSFSIVIYFNNKRPWYIHRIVWHLFK